MLWVLIMGAHLPVGQYLGKLRTLIDGLGQSDRPGALFDRYDLTMYAVFVGSSDPTLTPKSSISMNREPKYDPELWLCWRHWICLPAIEYVVSQHHSWPKLRCGF